MVCKNCGNEIDDKAVICPSCGVATKKMKQKKSLFKKWWFWVITAVLAVAIISTGAGGHNDEPHKVPNNETPNEQGNNSNAEDKTEFSVGETVELKGVQVTLLKVTESEGNGFLTPDEGNIYLICEFEICNNSDSDLAVSSMMSFKAYCDDYSVNQSLGGLQSPEANGKNQLDGSVAAGRKMNGVIAYEISKDYKTFEIRFTPNVWGGKEIIFIANK